MQNLEEFISEYINNKFEEKRQSLLKYLIDKRDNWLNDNVIKKIDNLEEKLFDIDEIFYKDVYLKFILNEMLGYIDLVAVKNAITDKSFIIASFALCGFANLSSIAIQIGGIGELAPNQRKNLSRLGLRALICGTLASYMSACIAGILLG